MVKRHIYLLSLTIDPEDRQKAAPAINGELGKDAVGGRLASSTGLSPLPTSTLDESSILTCELNLMFIFENGSPANETEVHAGQPASALLAA